MSETSEQGATMSAATPPAAPPPRSGGVHPALIGAAAAIVVLAVAGIAFAAAQLAAPGRTADVRPYEQPGPDGVRHRVILRGPVVEHRREDRRFGPGDARLRFTGLSPGALRGITISAISGPGLTLTTTDGWTRTITVSDSTTVRRAGQTITLSDLKVGDQIRFVQERNTDGSVTITAIEVVVPRVVGRVTATAGDSLTIERLDGTSMTIHVSATTTYHVRGIENATLADISVGMVILVQGTQDADGTLAALAVYGAASH